MTSDIYIIYDDPKIKETIENLDLQNTPFIHFVDELDRLEKKRAHAMKEDWGAVKSPFAIIYDKDKPCKAFYSEADDVLECIINYLKEYDSNKSNQ